MKFLFPFFLFAFAAVAIPIIIHLFNFRRYKTLYFSHVDFLKNIKKESQKKSRLKQLLILIARILAIACLVFAFSQPYIPLNDREISSKDQVVAVYIDNSFSMNARAGQGQLLEIARNKAVEMAQEYKPGTKFKLITNDLSPAHQHFLNKEQFIRLVTEIEPSPNVVPLSVIYNRLKTGLKFDSDESNASIYLVSDFQRISTDISHFENDSSAWIYCIPLTAQAANNLYIDSCWFETPSRKPGQEEELFVKIVNHSNEDYQNLPLKFFLNDSLKALSNFSVGAQEEIEVSLKYTNPVSGFQFGKAEITDYPVTHDNTYFISYSVQPRVKVLAISDGNRRETGLVYAKALFDGDEFTEMAQMNSQNLQITKFAEYNTIILLNIENYPTGFISEIGKAAANGSSIVWFPSASGNIQSYNQLLSVVGGNPITGKDTLKQPLGGMDINNPLFSGIFRENSEKAYMPSIRAHYRFNEQTRTNETKLLWFRNNETALSQLPQGEGYFYTFSFPLSSENEAFIRDVLFAPSLYSIVLNSIPRQNTNYTIGADPYILATGKEIINHEIPLSVNNLQTGEEFLPETSVIDLNKTRIGLDNRISVAGFYMIKSGEAAISSLAFNYNRDESDIRYFSAEEIKNEANQAGLKNLVVFEDQEARFSEIFKEIQNGKPLWKWFILMALLFIFTETLIIRFWK